MIGQQSPKFVRFGTASVLKSTMFPTNVVMGTFTDAPLSELRPIGWHVCIEPVGSAWRDTGGVFGLHDANAWNVEYQALRCRQLPTRSRRNIFRLFAFPDIEWIRRQVQHSLCARREKLRD